MEELDTNLLHNYFNGLLPAEQARAVEERAATEPEFGEEFALRKAMERYPKQEAERELLLASLKALGSEYFKEKVAESPQFTVARNNVRRWIALAASVTLIAAAIWFFRQEPKPVYEQFASHAPLSLTVMGNTQQAKTDAEMAFGQKDYAKALAALDQVLSDEPNNIKASFYRGICLLELGRVPESRQVFEPLASGNSALREDADWYIALSYLKEKNNAACKAKLQQIEPGAAHYKDAQKILEGL